MTRTFVYKGIDDIVADANARGLADSLPIAPDTARLAEPLRIGPLTAPNRCGIHPMEGCDATVDGAPSELTARRWQRFAAGGAGLVWSEATAVVPEGRANARQLLLSEANVDAFKDLVESTRAAARPEGSGEMVLGLQLTHSGRFSHPAPLPPTRNAALDALRGGDVEVLAGREFGRVVEAFVTAARRAADCGFDFVDIKQCHGYLLSELLSVGGSHLGAEIVMRVGESVPDLVLATRINLYDGWKGGLEDDSDAPEPVSLANVRRLVDSGVRLVSVTLGSPYLNPHIGRPYEKPPVDAEPAPEHPLIGVARHAAWTQRVADAVPDAAVVGAGWSWLRQFAPRFAARVGSGAFFVGRGALAYPEFARDVLTGGMSARNVCLTTSQCTALMRAKHNAAGQFPVGCVPRDADVYRPIYREMMTSRPDTS